MKPNYRYRYNSVGFRFHKALSRTDTIDVGVWLYFRDRSQPVPRDSLQLKHLPEIDFLFDNVTSVTFNFFPPQSWLFSSCFKFCFYLSHSFFALIVVYKIYSFKIHFCWDFKYVLIRLRNNVIGNSLIILDWSYPKIFKTTSMYIYVFYRNAIFSFVGWKKSRLDIHNVLLLLWGTSHVRCPNFILEWKLFNLNLQTDVITIPLRITDGAWC